MIGMIKTVMHIFLFGNTDYIEVVFFVGFGALAISKNKKILLYICTHIAGKRRKKKKLDKQIKHMMKISKSEEFEIRNGKKGGY